VGSGLRILHQLPDYFLSRLLKNSLGRHSAFFPFLLSEAV
jgi:hypothetical protein